MKPRDLASVERVCTAIRAAHKAHPHQRVGQLIVNAVDIDPFHMENDDLASALKDYARHPGDQSPGEDAG